MNYYASYKAVVVKDEMAAVMYSYVFTTAWVAWLQPKAIGQIMMVTALCNYFYHDLYSCLGNCCI